MVDVSVKNYLNLFSFMVSVSSDDDCYLTVRTVSGVHQFTATRQCSSKPEPDPLALNGEQLTVKFNEKLVEYVAGKGKVRQDQWVDFEPSGKDNGWTLWNLTFSLPSGSNPLPIYMVRSCHVTDLYL